MSKTKNYIQYTEVSYAGRKLLEEYPLSTIGIWHIFGEDANADLHGSHYMPPLGIVEGKLEDVIYYAVELPGFWQWGGGGEIRYLGTAIPKINADTAKKREALRREIEAAEANLADKKRRLEEYGG